MGATFDHTPTGTLVLTMPVLVTFDPPRGQQDGVWCLTECDLADLFRLPRLKELMKEVIKTIFQPRWGRGRWKSKT